MLPALRRTNANVWENPFDLWDRQFGSALRRLWSEADETEATGVYPVDVREDDEHLYIDAELPGFARDQVQVTYENGVLHLVAQRQAEETKAQTHLRERRYTRVARSFTLPTSVDSQRIEGKLENGVLRLTLHKTPEVKPRRVEIK